MTNIIPNLPCHVCNGPMSLGPEDRAAVCVECGAKQRVKRREQAGGVTLIVPCKVPQTRKVQFRIFAADARKAQEMGIDISGKARELLLDYLRNG